MTVDTVIIHNALISLYYIGPQRQCDITDIPSVTHHGLEPKYSNSTIIINDSLNN